MFFNFKLCFFTELQDVSYPYLPLYQKRSNKLITNTSEEYVHQKTESIASLLHTWSRHGKSRGRLNYDVIELKNTMYNVSVCFM